MGRKPWAGQAEASMKYQRRTIKRYSLNLNYHTDQDLISHLEGIDNVQGYIKSLIRSDLQRVNEKTT